MNPPQDIPLPEAATIVELLKINLKGVPLAEDVDLTELAKHMDGYSGADVTGVCVVDIRVSIALERLRCS